MLPSYRGLLLGRGLRLGWLVGGIRGRSRSGLWDGRSLDEVDC